MIHETTAIPDWNNLGILAAMPTQIAQKARLTFRGKPVFVSRGISVDFASKASGLFSSAFSAVLAGLKGEDLQDMGPIPDRDKNQLLLTGTALGSFSFEFELPTEESSLFPGTEAPKAMEKIETLFRLAAQGSDDEIAEVIEEVHPRAVRNVYAFLELLVQQQAWCALDFEERSFRFTDYAQIKMSSERLKADNIQERDDTYQGEFQGVLPASRTFEFRLSDKDVLKGKIGKNITDPDVLNRQWLYKPITIKLSTMQVGQGRPRYTLMNLNDLKDIPLR